MQTVLCYKAFKGREEQFCLVGKGTHNINLFQGPETIYKTEIHPKAVTQSNFTSL